MSGWLLAPGVMAEDLGFLPSLLSEDDPRPAREQLDTNYVHGGGGHWRTEPASIDQHYRLCYPGDPPQPWRAFTVLHGNEIVLLYPHDFVVIMQPDGSFVFQRMD